MVNENRYLFVFNSVILCERLCTSCHFDKESLVFPTFPKKRQQVSHDGLKVMFILKLQSLQSVKSDDDGDIASNIQEIQDRQQS